MRNLQLLLLIFLHSMLLFVPVAGEDLDLSRLRLRTAFAVRTEIPPAIDGRLTDEVWSTAIPITDFLQLEPDNLAPVTETTEARILYDNDNIYVAVRAYDSEPDKIVARLARRDAWLEAASSSAD